MKTKITNKITQLIDNAVKEYHTKKEDFFTEQEFAPADYFLDELYQEKCSQHNDWGTTLSTVQEIEEDYKRNSSELDKLQIELQRIKEEFEKVITEIERFGQNLEEESRFSWIEFGLIALIPLVIAGTLFLDKL